MPLDQAANFVVDELQSSVTDTATTFSVADASQFPDPTNGEYNLVVFDASRPSKYPDVEVVRVTGRDTTTDELTVTRGQETTTAASHASGTAVELSYTAKFRDDIQTEINNAGGTTVTSIVPTEADKDEEPVASGDKALAIGVGFTSDETDPVAVAEGTNSVAMGNNAKVEGSNSWSGTAIGSNAAAGKRSTAVGNDSSATADRSVAVGYDSIANSVEGIAIGRDSTASGEDSICIGSMENVNYTTSETKSKYDIAIGSNATTPDTTEGSAIAIGAGATADTAKQLVINLGLNNRVLSMDSDGNVTISGSLTENGSP